MSPNATLRPGTRRAVLALVAGLLLAGLAAGPVSAHLALEVSDPADGSTVTGTPTRITLTFTEDLVAGKSLFNLRGPDGAMIGRGEVDPAAPRTLVLVPPDLAAGAYVVEWQAAGDDGHLEKGKLGFTVAEPTPPPTLAPTATPRATGTPSAGPTASAAPTLSPTPFATASPTPGDGQPAASAGDVVIPILAGLLLVGGLGLFLLRRSRAA